MGDIGRLVGPKVVLVPLPDEPGSLEETPGVLLPADGVLACLEAVPQL